MEIHVVKSLAEYIKLLEEIGSTDTEKWYRGQSKSEYRLAPSALRKVFAIEDSKGYKINPPRPDNVCSGSNNLLAFIPVDKMVAEFREKSKQYLEYDAKTNIEWECIAQHYGIPTRVLDWTTNAINALFFAVEDCEIGEIKEYDTKYFEKSEGLYGGGGAVFVIDPLEINKITVPMDEPAIFDAIEDEKTLERCLYDLTPPVCFSGFNKEKRISRQAGKFTTTGSILWSMDYYEQLREKIVKIIIPYSGYNTIRYQLRALGITHETIYVEEDKKDVIAKKIANDAKDKFINMFSKKC